MSHQTQVPLNEYIACFGISGSASVQVFPLLTGGERFGKGPSAGKGRENSNVLANSSNAADSIESPPPSYLCGMGKSSFPFFRGACAENICAEKWLWYTGWDKGGASHGVVCLYAPLL